MDAEVEGQKNDRERERRLRELIGRSEERKTKLQNLGKRQKSKTGERGGERRKEERQSEKNKVERQERVGC